MQLSEQIKKLISQFALAKQLEQPEEGSPMIQVDEVASRIAAFYEHIRTVVEWKEEHLMRRAAIIRKLKRKFIEIELNTDGRIAGAAEGLVMELIRGGHFPNGKLAESKIAEVAEIIEKYFVILRQQSRLPAGRQGLQFYNWLLEVASCEIEDALAPAVREKALIEFMFWTMKDSIKVSEKIYENGLLRKGDEDIQIYIATCQALFSLDVSIISYNLIKYKYPEWTTADQKLISEVAANIFQIWQEIQANMRNPLAHKFYRICEQYDTPYLLLGDILLNSDPEKVAEEIAEPPVLEEKIRDAYKKRLKALRAKISRAAVYLTLSIFITKILFLVLLEIIIGWATQSHVNFFILAADVLIPTCLMLLIVLLAKKPSAKNLNVVVIETMKIAYPKNENDAHEIKLNKKKSLATRAFISFLYTISSGITFGGLIFILYILGFPVTSIVIDIMFIALILFAATAVDKRARELTMEPDKEGVLSFVRDIFFLPLQSLGKWLSHTWRQYNAAAALFNALIDMPFTAFIEFVEGWRYFIKERKEEIR